MNGLQRLYAIRAETVGAIFKVIIGWGMVGGLVWLFFFHKEGAVYNRDPRMAEMCMDWRIETPLEKHFDGPYIRDECIRYFQHRTAEQENLDAKYWREKITDAQKDWGEYKPDPAGN